MKGGKIVTYCKEAAFTQLSTLIAKRTFTMQTQSHILIDNKLIDSIRSMPKTPYHYEIGISETI